jgi:hypothetical protein
MKTYMLRVIIDCNMSLHLKTTGSQNKSLYKIRQLEGDLDLHVTAAEWRECRDKATLKIP